MFRFRKHSVESTSPVSSSSLSNGNASIIPNIKIEDELPIRTVIDEPMVEEPITLEPRRETLHHDITIESMSAVIAAAVQISSGKAPSSLSLGNASIIPSTPKIDTDTKKKPNRLFTNPFKKTVHSPTHELSEDDASSQNSSPRSSSSAVPSTVSPQPELTLDDGRDELLYRGIQIKEIKTTLKTLIISDQDRCPMPSIRLERPGFARINY